MTTPDTKPAPRRRWRTALATIAAVLIGLCLLAGLGLETPFGKKALKTVMARLSTIHQNLPEFDKLMGQAHEALAQGHPDVAIIFLKNAASEAPKNGNIRLQLGQALLSAGDAASAEHELRSALQYGAPDAHVLPILYAAMLTRSEGQQLLAQFPAPADGDHSVLASDTLRARALAQIQVGSQDDAAASLDRALALDRSVVNLVTRAQLAQSMGATPLATKLTDEAIAKAPSDTSAMLTKIDLLLQAKQDDKALALANELVKDQPKSPAALMTRAGVYLQLHQNGKALSDINASLKQVPDMTVGLFYKAVAMEQAKDVKDAWNLAQALPPAFVNSRVDIGSAVSQMAIAAGHFEIGTNILSATVLNFPQNVEARVRLGARYLQLKDPARALETLLPMKDAPDPRVMVLLGQAYGMQKQYGKSIEYLERASDTGIGGDQLKREIAISNLQAGNLDKAIGELASLNAAQPGDPQTAGPLIDALLQEDDFPQALDVANKLTSAAPNNPYGPLFQGQLLMSNGDLDGAVDAFSHALALNAKFVPAIYERAAALAARGDLEAANADLHTILAADPKNMMAQIKTAQIAAQAGQDSKAAALLKQAAAAHPKDALPNLVLANYDLQQGRLDNAAAVIASFLNVDPGNPSALAMQGDIQMTAGKVDQAIATFRQLASAYPQSPQIQILLGAALAKKGDVKDAMSTYQQAVQMAPMLQETRIALIQYALATKNEAAALSAARDFAARQPGPASAQTLARTFATLNKFDEAVTVLSDSQAQHPSDITLIPLSALLRKQGDAKKADALLTSWLAKHPDDVAVRMEYAQAQLTADPVTAEDQYRKVLALQPYNLAALNNLGWLLQKKNPKEALVYAERAAKIAPASAAVLDTLAWTQWQLNDRNIALSLLQRAHSGDQNNAEIAYHLAIALDGANQRAEAKKMLQALLAAKQDFADKETAQALVAQWH